MACSNTKTIGGLLAGTFVFGLVFGASVSAQDRMPPIPADKLTAAQKQTVDEYRKARGGEPGGPWAVLTRSPELMSRTLMLSDYLRFKSTLPPRLSEFVILMTAREWGQNYEWNAHHPLAVKGGLNPRYRQSGRGRPPPRADGGGRDKPVRPDPGTAAQSNGQRFHLRTGGVDVRRAGSRGRGEHFGLLHDGRDAAEHRAYAARARRPRAAAGFSVKPAASVDTCMAWTYLDGFLASRRSASRS